MFHFLKDSFKSPEETAAQSQAEQVVLLHGIAESAVHMMPLEWALGAAGYAVHNVNYPSTRLPCRDLAEQFIRPLIRQHASAGKLHFVTHSLGGILLRYCLQDGVPENMGRVVMHAPGHHGSPMLELHRRHPLFTALMGPALDESGVGPESFARKLKTEADYEFGVLAGALPLDPVAIAALRWPHDGRLEVEDTKLDSMTDFALIPSSHDLITFHPIAIYQTQQFLRHGRFVHS